MSSNTAYGKGHVEQFTLRISPVERHATGYQLAIRLPDRETEAALRDFYNGVFNGGAINDQKNYDFGNESDGWYYAGSCWMYGLTLAAGTPAGVRATGPACAGPGRTTRRSDRGVRCRVRNG